jgi:biotin synthase-like enzyme
MGGCVIQETPQIESNSAHARWEKEERTFSSPNDCSFCSNAHLLNNPTKESKFKRLDQREKMSMAIGASQHAAIKAIEPYNGIWDPAKKATMGIPERKPGREYISAIKEIAEHINTAGSISTVKNKIKTR